MSQKFFPKFTVQFKIYWTKVSKPWDNLFTKGTKWFSKSWLECSAAIALNDSTAYKNIDVKRNNHSG